MSEPVEARLAEALALHEAGALEAADRGYAEVLLAQPGDFTALHQRGVLRNQWGQFEAAIPFFTQALALRPRSALGHANLGFALWQAGRPEEAAFHLQFSLALNPRQPDVLLNAAGALHAMQRSEEALARLEQLLALKEHVPEALLNQGIILTALGEFDAAIASFDALLALQPGQAQALMNRGNAYLGKAQAEQALADYDAALGQQPAWVEAHLNRGQALLDLKRFEAAREAFDAALALAPERVEACLGQATVSLSLERAPEALAWLDRALAAAPERPEAHMHRANVLLQLRRPEEALAAYDRALLLRPDFAAALSNRGHALLLLNRPEAALESCDRALEMDPELPDAHGYRGFVLLKLGRPLEALDSVQRCLGLRPDHFDVLNFQATLLHLLGRHAEAVASARRALELQPGFAPAHTNLIFCLDYLPESGFAELQAERSRYCSAQTQALPLQPPLQVPDPDPERPLVLGYVSADFYQHSAAHCFGPVLRRHDRSRFRIHCYSGVLQPDALTKEFQAGVDLWRDALLYSDEALAAQIRADRVDILIDLSGHTSGNRLPVFARKPAPIQVTAWGHNGGTGLPMVDYQFVDRVLVPEWARPLFAEASFDLPCCLPFEPPLEAPEVTPLPALARGHLTFGSLNRFAKVRPEVLDHWARILAAVPGSRLLLKGGGFEATANQDAIRARFRERGVDPLRLEFRGQTTHQAHLAAYGDIDLVLDTFPQNGGVTTWEALWMGTPVVTLLGNQLSTRISGAILHALGLGNWVCADQEGYLDLAIQRARDLQGLAAFRASVRARILASEAGNPERYTRAVEAAYRSMWRRFTAAATASGEPGSAPGALRG